MCLSTGSGVNKSDAPTPRRRVEIVNDRLNLAGDRDSALIGAEFLNDDCPSGARLNATFSLAFVRCPNWHHVVAPTHRRPCGYRGQVSITACRGLVVRVFRSAEKQSSDRRCLDTPGPTDIGPQGLQSSAPVQGTRLPRLPSQTAVLSEGAGAQNPAQHLRGGSRRRPGVGRPLHELGAYYALPCIC